MIARLLSSALLACGLVALVGCSSGGLKVVEVEGQVSVNKKPLDKIQVEFIPVAEGPRSVAVTDGQGRYVLMYHDGKTKGAVVGQHKVVLRDVGIMADKFLGRKGEMVDTTGGKKPRIPAVYSDMSKTPIVKEVTAGKNQIDLDLQP